MTPLEAAWVRENVWTPGMRKTYRTTPDYMTSCECQYGITGHCQAGRCHQCRGGVALPGPVTYICGRDGETPMLLPEPYEYPAVSATGRHETSVAMVWYADRLCRWICPCACHERTRGEQAVLFDLAVST